MSTSSFERDNSELTPVTASIGFNDGANKGFWRVQPRQKTGKKRGRWIEMGAELRAYFKNALGEAAAASGRAIGSDGTPDGVRVYITGQADKGIPDGIYGFKTKDVMVAEALLPDEYVEGKGLAAKIPSDIDVANLPNIGDLERVDITPDDIRLANEGINTPEGQEMSKFKDSPEGQEIARLDEAEVVSAEELQDIVEPGAKKESVSPKVERATKAWLNSASRKNGDPVYLTSTGRDRVTEAWVGDDGGIYTGDVDSPSDFIGYIDDIFASMDSGRGIQSIYKGRPPLATDENGRLKVATKMDIIRMERETDARKAGAKRPPAADNEKPAATVQQGLGGVDANWSEPDENGYSRFTTPEGITVSAGLNGWSISDNYGMNAGFSTSNAEVGPNDIEVSKAEVLEELNRTGIDNLVATPEAAEALGLPEGYVARGGGKYIAAYIPDSKDASGLYLREDEKGEFEMGGTALYLADYDFRRGLISPYGEYDNKEDALKDMRALAFKIPSGGRPRDVDSQDAMARAIAEAMGGGTPDLDKTIEAARRPSDEDDEEINLDEFDEADGIDEFDDSFVDTSDPEFRQTPIAKENVAAEDLQMDDFISVGGQTLKVVGLQYNDDDSVTVRAANADGFIDEYERSDYNLITEFGAPKQKPKPAPKAAPKPVPEAAPTPTPAPKPARKAKPKAAPKAAEPTPETAPEPTPVPEAAPTVSLPENATKVKDVNDLQYGDILYTEDGLELGKFLGIESKGPSGTTVKVSKNGTIRPVTLTGRKPLFMTREVEEEETPTPTPTPRPTSFGRGVDPRTPEGYAALDSSLRKALDKWAADNDGSPELFDGVKAILDDPNMSGDQRVQAIADAIANAQLTRMESNINGRQARLNAAQLRGIRILLENAGFETEITRRQKAAKAAEEEILRRQSMPDRRDKGKDFGFPPGKTEEILRKKKVEYLRDADGKRVKSVNPETGEEKSTYAENPDAILDAILEEFPEAPVTETGSIIAARTRFTDPDGAEYVMESKITRTNGSNYMISFDITDEAGNSTELFHYDYRDSFSSIFGVKNGIQRMTRILSGDLTGFMEKSKAANNNEWKTYFASGKLSDRLEYFSGSRSRATRETLVADVAKAKAGRNKYEIDDAEYQLDLLDNFFDGDIEKYRDNSKLQSAKLLTIEDTVDKYANGRGYLLNRARGKAEGTVMRSAVNGIYGAIKDKDSQAMAQVMKELFGRLPELPKHPKVVQTALERIRAGVKLRFPNENQRELGAVITNGYKVLSGEGLDAGAQDSAPHVSWDGRILEKGFLVEYTNNDNETSVGFIDSLVESEKNADRPNQYSDYVLVRFRDQSGRIGSPIKLPAKNLAVLDNTGMSDEALGRLTAYSPNLKDDEMRLARFGEAFMIQKMARDSMIRMDQMNEIGDGFRPPKVDPAFWSNDNASPGRYLYDKNGLPLGQIAAVRVVSSDSVAASGFNIAYVTPDGKLEFIGVKSGEIRAPKEDLNSKDGRGSNDSDEDFTPDPANFSDIGLDASSIGSDAVDPESALIDTVNSAPISAAGSGLIAGSLASLVKVQSSKAALEADPTDENKAAYKDALSSYYGRLSVLNAMAGVTYDRNAAPLQVSSDNLLTPEDVADINGKIRATVKEEVKSPDAVEVAPLTYEQLVEARSAAENTYSGYLPQGWAPQPVQASMDFEKNKHAEVFKEIVSTVAGDSLAGISDSLAEALAVGLMRSQLTNPATNEYDAPNFHSISNELGDTIRVSRKRKPGEEKGYNSTDAEIDTVVGVLQRMRDKLNIGDKPFDFAMFDSKDTEPTSALGFVYTKAMWSNTSAYQARAHAIMDKLPGMKKEMLADKGKPFEPGKSWWAVDLDGREDDLLEYIASHEMGHVMQGEAMRQFGQNLSQAVWNKFYGPVASSHRVSQYGTTNNNEHFAESFAKFLMTGQAHPEFMKFLETTGLLK